MGRDNYKPSLISHLKASGEGLSPALLAMSEQPSLRVADLRLPKGLVSRNLIAPNIPDFRSPRSHRKLHKAKETFATLLKNV